ncbi:threonine/serine ThrE exporter family protein [Solicola sp. PLA-1-18]|uniref:threonine/serine ThrE exporter family protein n=1 Tax=Solicola sp. PLA-1-18 TaxID=3380532 RepID=UPI003B79D3FB
MADAHGEVYLTVDLALRIGEILLGSGAGAPDVAVTMRAVTEACGMRGCVVDINFTTLAVAYQETPESAPETHLRQVQRRGLDFGALTAVDHVVRELASGRMDRAEASAAVWQLQSTANPYPRWVSTLATGVMAAGISLLLGGRALVVLSTFVVALLIDDVNRRLGRRRIPAFYQQVAGALIATAAAVVLHLSDAPVNPSLVIASGIVILLAGISLVGAIQDALSGYYVTGAARSFEAVLLTGGVIAGVSMGLSIADNFGVDLEVRSDLVGLGALPMQLVGAAVASIAFATVCQVPLRALLPCGAIGLAAQLLYQVALQARLGPTAGSTIAALGVGLVAYALASRIRVPPLVVVTTAIVALLPGLAIYQGLFLLLGQDDTSGLFSLLTAGSVAVALASGAILGEYIAQPLAREARRLENRWAGPRLVGPLGTVDRRVRRAGARRLRRIVQQEEDDAPEDPQLS